MRQVPCSITSSSSGRHFQWRLAGRQGIALMTLNKLLDDAGRLGCHKIQLLSNKAHATDSAHDLYREAGFVDEAEGFRLYLTTDAPGLVDRS